jgi:hypothetical protein
MVYPFTYTCPNCEADIDCAIDPLVRGSRRGHPDTWTPDEGGEVECPDTCPECGTKLDEDLIYKAGNDCLANEEPDYLDED